MITKRWVTVPCFRYLWAFKISKGTLWQIFYSWLCTCFLSHFLYPWNKVFLKITPNYVCFPSVAPFLSYVKHKSVLKQDIWCIFSAHMEAWLNSLIVKQSEGLPKGIIRTALPTQKTSGQASVLLATEMWSMMFGRPSQADDLTIIPGRGK